MLCADCLVIWIFLESSLLKTEVIACTSTKQIHIFFKICGEKIQATNVLSNYGHFSASVHQILFLTLSLCQQPNKINNQFKTSNAQSRGPIFLSNFRIPGHYCLNLATFFEERK